MPPTSTLLFQPRQRIVIIGDSITDCGRRDRATAPYGNGYVALVRALLLACHPTLSLEVVNRGIGGDTIRDLEGRWDRDAIAERPDWLSVMIGVNDAWQPLAGNAAKGVPLEAYEHTYRRLLEAARDRTAARLILMEPFVMAPPVPDDEDLPAATSAWDVRRVLPTLAPGRRERENTAFMARLRRILDGYGEVVRRLAGEYDAVLVRTQAAFDEAIAAQPPAVWGDEQNDQVHPGLAGHAVIARCFLRAVGYGDL